MSSDGTRGDDGTGDDNTGGNDELVQRSTRPQVVAKEVAQGVFFPIVPIGGNGFELPLSAPIASP